MRRTLKFSIATIIKPYTDCRTHLLLTIKIRYNKKNILATNLPSILSILNVPESMNQTYPPTDLEMPVEHLPTAISDLHKLIYNEYWHNRIISDLNSHQH